VSFDAKAPAAARFEIPTGYQKKAAPAVVGGSLPPEVQKQMEEAIKNLTPEQRAQFEKMMKAQQSHQQGQ
jgi:Spy/CpxP family protein refolding chaperone